MNKEKRVEERILLLMNEFSNLNGWEDRYKKIIEKGKDLEPLPEQFKVEKNKVKGCQSQVWLIAELNTHGEIVFRADSDALIVRGLIAILLQVYTCASPTEILQTAPDFLQKMGFNNNLSPSRTNGLYSMVKQINYYALAYKALLEKK